MAEHNPKVNSTLTEALCIPAVSPDSAIFFGLRRERRNGNRPSDPSAGLRAGGLT